MSTSGSMQCADNSIPATASDCGDGVAAGSMQLDIDSSTQLTVSKELKERRRRQSKHTTSKPLGVKTTSRSRTRDEKDAGDLEHLQKCKELLQHLPAQSTYANHRRKVVQRAIEILQERRQLRSQEAQAELEGLLKRLQLA